MLASVSFLIWAIYNSRKSPERYSSLAGITSTTSMPGPPEFYCPLDGTPLRDRASTMRRPIVVQIDNAPAARNQSGLSQADIVYEAMAEGEVTRFSAIFDCRDADVVGPVRSARLINIQLVPEYQALLSNSGSSAGVTAELEGRPDIPNINHNSYSDAYWRAADRVGPHDLMTSTSNLRAAAVGAGFADTSDLVPLTFKDDTPAPAITTISIPYSGIVQTGYTYDAGTNSWLRSIGGEAHIDTLTGRQIAAKNVIIQYVSINESSIEEDVGGNRGLEFGLTGSGKALIFRDGQVITATWTRAALNQMTLYTDAAGLPVPLNRGLTFIQLVQPDFQASWG
ncbi:MAG: DUF3048 domain-containing protein [Thermoleophilia bacterium]